MAKLPGWVTGLIGGIILAAITGTAGMLLSLSIDVASLKATQVQLIKEIDRALDELSK